MKKIFFRFVFLILAVLLLLADSPVALAKLSVSDDINGIKLERSIETLRDLEYQTWQLVVYSEDASEDKFVLRVVGYPGSLRLNHPYDLDVQAGIKNWGLKDITFKNKLLVNDSRQAALEFDLAPLLKDLKNNRPLRLFLPGAFNELPVPPYVVKEWRSLIKSNSLYANN